MGKTKQREGSTLTNDQIIKLKEADSIITNLSARVILLKRQYEVGVLSKDAVLDALNTRIRTEYDRYNELVHDVELATGTSVYFLGYQEMCLKDWRFMTVCTEML